MIPTALWEPMVLGGGAVFGALIQSVRPGPAYPTSERARDLGSLVLAVAISGIVRNLWLPPTAGDFRAGRTVAALVIFDLFLYGLHRFGHGAGWRMHHAHHAPLHFGVGMAFRDSVVHLLLYTVALVGMAFAFGLNDRELAAISATLIGFQWWTHTRTWCSLGPLDWLLIGPRHHYLHHALPMKAGLVNLGGLLCVWDQLFGTYQHPPVADPTPADWPRRSSPRLRHWLGV